MINLNDLKNLMLAISNCNDNSSISCNECKTECGDICVCPLDYAPYISCAASVKDALDKYMQKSSAGPYTVVDEVEFVSLIMTGG